MREYLLGRPLMEESRVVLVLLVLAVLVVLVVVGLWT